MAKITWDNRTNSGEASKISASIFNEIKTSVNAIYDDDKSLSGSINISGSIIPNTADGENTSSFDLGSATAAWNEIFVATSSINFVSPDGTITKWSKQDVTNLRAGKSLNTSSKQIVNENDDSTFVRMSTAGKAFHVASDKTLIKLQTSSFELGATTVPSKLVGSTVGITGSTHISGSSVFTTTDLLTLLGNFGQTGSFAVSGSSSFTGDVNMDGIVTTQDLLTVVAGINATGSVDVTGSITASSGLIVTGSTNISGSNIFTTTDLLTLLGNFGQTGSFNVSGSSSFTGDVNMDGAVTTQDLLTVVAGINATGSVNVTGSVTASSGLEVTGSTTISGSFNNDGTGSFTGSVETTGSIIHTGSTNTIPPPVVVAENVMPSTNTLFYGYLFNGGNPDSMQVQAANYSASTITYFRFSTSSQAEFNSLNTASQDTFFTAISASASNSQFTNLTFTPVSQYPSHSYKYTINSVVDSGSFYQANVSFTGTSSLGGGVAPAIIEQSGGGANGRWKFVTNPAVEDEPTGGFNVGDLMDFLASFGATGISAENSGFDFNLNGTVGVGDLMLLLAGFGNPQEACSDLVYPSNTNNNIAGPVFTICDGYTVTVNNNAFVTIT